LPTSQPQNGNERPVPTALTDAVPRPEPNPRDWKAHRKNKNVARTETPRATFRFEHAARQISHASHIASIAFCIPSGNFLLTVQFLNGRDRINNATSEQTIEFVTGSGPI